MTSLPAYIHIEQYLLIVPRSVKVGCIWPYGRTGSVNLFLFATGRIQVNAPAILTRTTHVTDPLPQALVLTAIVIGFATTAFIVQLALRSRYESGTDHVDSKEEPTLTYDPREDEP